MSDNNISLDDVCTLISFNVTGKDNLNQSIKSEVKTETFCYEMPVYNNEFFAAAQTGIKSSCILAIDFESYDNQTIVEHNGNRYSIYKVFKRSDNFIELHCTEKTGVK